jgi:hypothetical protein
VVVHFCKSGRVAYSQQVVRRTEPRKSTAFHETFQLNSETAAEGVPRGTGGDGKDPPEVVEALTERGQRSF